MTKNPKFATREEWLSAAVDSMRDRFLDLEVQMPPVIHISTGWSKGARPNQRGWCWRPDASEDSAPHIFISPTETDTITVLGITLHECCHAADENRDEHGGRFKRLWAEVGFVGKATTSTPGEELEEYLRALGDKLGDYPHAGLTPGTVEKKPGSRLIKVMVEDGCCTYTARVTRKWLEEGNLSCPHGADLVEQEPKQ